MAIVQVNNSIIRKKSDLSNQQGLSFDKLLESEYNEFAYFSLDSGIGPDVQRQGLSLSHQRGSGGCLVLVRLVDV